MSFPYPECPPGTVLIENKRYFGKFKCRSCARWWMSGNSWLGSRQNYTGCGKLTFPWKLSYLQLPSTAEGETEKEHPQRECERCRRLGYYCGNSENVKVEFHRRHRTNHTVTSSITPQAKTNSATSSNYDTDFPPLGGNSARATSNNLKSSLKVTSNDTSRDVNSTQTSQSSPTNPGAFNLNSNYYNRSNLDFVYVLIYVLIVIFGCGIYNYLLSRH